MRTKGLPAPSRALVRVEEQFTTWRQERKSGRDLIPEGLWSAAVALCRHLSISQVSSRLRLSHATLKKRVLASRMHTPAETPIRQETEPAAEFIAINLAHPPAAVDLQLEHRNGSRLHLRLAGTAELDLPSLCESFWRGQACSR
jgi:hypothetical protein